MTMFKSKPHNVGGPQGCDLVIQAGNGPASPTGRGEP